MIKEYGRWEASSLVLEQSEKERRITGNYLHEQLVWEALQSLRAWSFGSRHCMNLRIKQMGRDEGYRLPTTLNFKDNYSFACCRSW